MSTCTMTWPIATDVAIDSGKIEVSLFVTVKDVAYANSASSTSTPSCASDSTGAGTFVCAGLAVPYPYIGSGSPTITSFKVTQSNGYLGKVHVAVLEGQPVGAFVRPYFDGTNEGDIDCKTGSWLKSLTKNSDGTYRIKIAADGSTDFDIYEAFKLENHSGTCKSFSGTSYDYTATKL